MTVEPPSPASLQRWHETFRLQGVERLSIEVTERCTKGCWFCYNRSHPHGQTSWTPQSLVDLITDCARYGTKAVSFGGGEPLQFEGLEEVLRALSGVVFRSLTTHGLLLRGPKRDALLQARPDKIHLSIHLPDDRSEVERVIQSVQDLQTDGIPAGINLLVQRSRLEAAKAAVAAIQKAGIGLERLVFLPMRGQDTPSPQEIADVAGGRRFQSVSCLTACGPSPRFAAIDARQTVAFCSYTSERRPLEELSFEGLCRAVSDLRLRFCGGVL